MESILISLKNDMIANKKNPQPADGEMYWIDSGRAKNQ